MQGAGIRKAGSLHVGYRMAHSGGRAACSVPFQIDAEKDCEMREHEK